jgi:ankyrin repeat protein
MPTSTLRGTTGATALALALCAAPAIAAEPALVSAATQGDVAAVGRLLKSRAPVDDADATGTTALHWAVRGGHTEVVRQLLAAGANVKAANRYGVTALQLAAVNADAAMVDVLLKAGADPNATLPEGETVLMTAVRGGVPAVVGRLLEAGAKVDARESFYGETALHWAAADNHADAIRMLVKAGSPVNERSGAQVFARRRSGQSVLPLGSWTPLMYAVRQNAADAVTALLGLGADLNAQDPDGATALIIALLNAHYDVAGTLIDAGADVNILDNEAGTGALYYAIDMHRLTIGHGRPNPHEVGTLTALDIVRKLLEKGANPNVVSKALMFQRQHTFGDTSLGKGATPFLRAAKSGDIQVLRLLVAAGADPKVKMPNGANALHLAAGLGWRDGSAAAPSYDQGTEPEAVATIDLLLDLGLSLSDTTDAGDTPLHASVTRSSTLIIQHLLDKGADKGAVNKKGLTPFAVAKAIQPAVRHKDLVPTLTLLMRPGDTMGGNPLDSTARVPLIGEESSRPRPARPPNSPVAP